MRKIDPFHYGRIEKDEVNQQAFENYFQLIDEAERFYNDQIRRVVKSMSTGKDKTDVICLSGPSASGKTTTAHTLARHFISSGRRAMVISLDDFYLDTEKTPLNRKGKPDFETIYSLDIERINLCIDELVNKGKTLMPIFDFHTRKQVEGQEKEIAISGDDVVIIEGLHGLNPLLTQRVGEDKVTRIFASVRSRFTDHDRVLLTPQDVRLMRRMVRDRSTRNTTPEQTMSARANRSISTPTATAQILSWTRRSTTSRIFFTAIFCRSWRTVPESLLNTTVSWMNCTSAWMSFLTSTTPRRFRRTVSFGNLSVRAGKASRQNKKRI